MIQSNKDNPKFSPKLCLNLADVYSYRVPSMSTVGGAQQMVLLRPTTAHHTKTSQGHLRPTPSCNSGEVGGHHWPRTKSLYLVSASQNPHRCCYPVVTLRTTFPQSSREHRDMWSQNAQRKGFRGSGGPEGPETTWEVTVYIEPCILTRCSPRQCHAFILITHPTEQCRRHCSVGLFTVQHVLRVCGSQEESHPTSL